MSSLCSYLCAWSYKARSKFILAYSLAFYNYFSYFFRYSSSWRSFASFLAFISASIFSCCSLIFRALSFLFLASSSWSCSCSSSKRAYSSADIICFGVSYFLIGAKTLETSGVLTEWLYDLTDLVLFDDLTLDLEFCLLSCFSVFKPYACIIWRFFFSLESGAFVLTVAGVPVVEIWEVYILAERDVPLIDYIRPETELPLLNLLPFLCVISRFSSRVSTTSNT